MPSGVDYFTREDEREWQRLFDRAWVNWTHQQLVRTPPRDFERQPSTLTEAGVIYNQVCQNNNYDDWRRRRDRDLEGERVFWKGVNPLDLDKLAEINYDRPKLQPFKMKYDTLDEVRMRFNKTVILIKGNPFGVSDQRIVKDQFYLLLDDVSGKKSYVAVDDVPDFRPAAPGYVRVGESNGYLRRSPARVNQQGMTNQSVTIRRVGSRDNLSFNTPSLLDALTSRGKTLPWEKSYRKLIDDRIVQTLRLSDTLAVYKKPNFDPIVVEYKGRRLGELHDHTVKVFDEDDMIQPWLKADVKKVDLEVIS